MLNASLALFLVSFISALVGSLGVGYSPSGILGAFALITLAFGIASLVGGLSVLLHERWLERRSLRHSTM